MFNFIFCLVLMFVIFFHSALFAKSDFERFGDVGQIPLPVGALGATVLAKDKTGSLQLAKAFFITQGCVYGLKYSIQEERPNKADNYSFPSGHTSSAFCGASFVHQRYGLWYGIPAYIIATLVGVSRVDSNNHYPHDVIVGAAIGIGSNILVTSKYTKDNISLTPINDGIMISWNTIF